MQYLLTNWSQPYYNMALEEHLMTSAACTDDYCFFYVHTPSIIVGRFQNTLEEINADAVKAQRLHVARRISGGGAVYHDEGNLNFSFVVQDPHASVTGFERFTQPLLDTLRSLNIDAQLSGRNDILIDEKKISGNAQCRKNGRLLQHGTILFDSNLESLVRALNPGELKLSSNAVKSIRSRVTNVADHLHGALSLSDFRALLLSRISETYPLAHHTLSASTCNAVEALVKSKFGTWDWNYSRSPRFAFSNKKKFSFGIVDARLNVRQGFITELALYGDFFAAKDIGPLVEQLIGTPYTQQALLPRLKALRADTYIIGMTSEQLSELILGKAIAI